MTSYSPPDYYAVIKISSIDFKNLKGHTFNVLIYIAKVLKSLSKEC